MWEKCVSFDTWLVPQYDTSTPDLVCALVVHGVIWKHSANLVDCMGFFCRSEESTLKCIVEFIIEVIYKRPIGVKSLQPRYSEYVHRCHQRKKNAISFPFWGKEENYTFFIRQSKSDIRVEAQVQVCQKNRDRYKCNIYVHVDISHNLPVGVGYSCVHK